MSLDFSQIHVILTVFIVKSVAHGVFCCWETCQWCQFVIEKI